MMERELKPGGEIHFVEDSDGLLSFFVSREIGATEEGPSNDICYLGLSGTRSGQIGKGVRLACVNHKINQLKQRTSAVCVIATCATAPSLFAFRSFAGSVMPDEARHLDNRERQSLRWFKRWFGWSAGQGEDDSLVMRGASDARFTEAELSRQTAEKYSDPVFDALAIDERKGDRLILVGWVG